MITLKPRAEKEALGCLSSLRRVAIDPADRQIAPHVRRWVSEDGNEEIYTADVEDLWVAEVLPGQHEWILASRVVGDDRGVPVICEVRLFPNVLTPAQGKFDSPAEWAADVLGSSARPIPRGGLSSTILRHEVAKTIRHHARAATVLKNVREWKTSDGPAKLLRELAAMTARAGIRYVSPFKELDRLSRKAQPKPGGRGRPRKWFDPDLMRIALLYDDARRAGQAPIPAIAAAEKIGRPQARNLVAQARARRFLLEASLPGRASETLPESARRTLEVHVANHKGKVQKKGRQRRPR